MQSGSDNVKSRLDMALVNGHWLQHYSNSKLFHIDAICSDHLPILLVINCDENQELKKWNISHYGNIDQKVFSLTDQLKQLNSNPYFIQNNEAIKISLEDLLVTHFKNISTTTNPILNNDFLNCTDNCITDEDNEKLLSPITLEEVKNTIKQMGPWTAPGTDGFPPGFYKQNLKLLENDVWEIVKSFFHSKHLLKEMNHTFISLIPKVNKLNSPADFRHISLCNYNYKIISKILVNRMKPLLSKLISPYQASYDPGRNIQNNVIIAHELVYTLKKKKDRCGIMGLKLDTSKAFDRVECPFLIVVLKKLASLTTGVSYDCLLFTKATHSETSNLMSLIKDFSSICGQMINFEKSACFFSKNVQPDHCVSLIRAMNVKKVELNEKYLGIPLFITRNRTESMSHLSTHHNSIVSNWKGKHLAQAGRSILVQHTLKSSSNYHMNSFLLPDSIINKMEQSQRDFWWGKNGHRGYYFRKWEKIYSHKLQGGLGFRNLKKMNLSLLAKTAWLLIHFPNDPWVKILRCKYFKICHPLYYKKLGVSLGFGPVFVMV
ncbi:uncharacterized protein LOC113360630 [Papaver somniferum]|uniref:uncharacterized protein LOC113360630 n=1 Tax=Papaver somniferum TaxID=3469 RepID=UPI000E6FC3CC|nr:uncharacterized protein LOC113360630 [Papaver somniferum]